MTANPRRDRLVAGASPLPQGRSLFAEDRDRILAASAFWRLRHVTQVMTPSAPGQFHNRLTHSLAVARIGRQMANALLARAGGAAEAAGGLDSDVVEAACLAHDLGHPPFGHDAEDELDRALTAAGVADGFEANAQSFRIVTRLAERSDGGAGLNLTRATTSAILKYPWTRDESPMPGKWGVYESEREALVWARALMPTGSQEPTLEAGVMDLADLVAYAVHDFEDFVRADAIPMQRLAADLGERDRFLGLVAARRRIAVSEHDDLSRILAHILTSCPSPLTTRGRSAVDAYATGRIDAVIEAVTLGEGRAGSTLIIDRERELEIFLLEGLTWHYVIDSDLLHPHRDEQRAMIRALFDRLADAAMSEGGRERFPAFDRERLRDAGSEPARLRVVADVIASMSEGEAVESFKGVTG